MFVPVMVRASSEAAMAATLPTSLNVAACPTNIVAPTIISTMASGIGLEHAAALQGHDADAVRPEFRSQLASQDVDRAEGTWVPPI